MVVIQSFPPIVNTKSKILILGSMPGQKSLDANQYYAHPRNQFWPIMASLLGYSLPLAYSEKKKMLLQNHIALWDVVGSCRRKGSMDKDIRNIIFNDFEGLFSQYRNIKHVFCNGQKAHTLFHKEYGHLDVSIEKLPSTSPAYVKPLNWKIKRWHVIRTYV